MTTDESLLINEYTNSMFRHERLHEKWIASCATYLETLFGDSLRGKTVVDYAFGRGNWSLAFLRAGASKVIAVDASSDCVTRFKDYSRDRNIENLEILVGNIMEKDLPTRGDLIWLYGILPNIEEPATFLNRIKTLAASKDSQIYVYQFNANSLLEFTVQTCREIIVYQSESEYREDSYLFVRPARMRARDDLTAPKVTFSTASEMQQLLRSCGIYIKRRDEDFQQFLRGDIREDFYPHQFLCSLNVLEEVEVSEPHVPYATEVEVLREIAREVFFKLKLTPIEKRKIAVGLFNTHFAFLKNGLNAYHSLIEIFLFMMYIILQSEVKSSGLEPSVVPYYALFHAALLGEDYSYRVGLIPEETQSNKLIDYLLNNNLRN